MGRRFGEFKHLPISPVLREYVLRSGTPLDPVMTSLVDETQRVSELSIMLVPEEQANLMTLLTKVQSAAIVLDLGTFTGCSALAFARGLSPTGRVITCDISDEHLDVARHHWKWAGVDDRIDFRLGPAEATLEALAAEETRIDIAFLDADKENYGVYFDLIEPMLRPGGLLLVDNALFNGYVLAPELAPSELIRGASAALRDLNARLAADDRFETVMLPMSDGLTIARKKSREQE
ncbi:O-methyltransferase [Amycolatopsis sp. NPDC102389]|uniref:O-methyltransferase n=1 Tax=Amycolatopsis sp. NPDC102389 TaxID=3363941 RepID=UPI0037F4C76B